MVWGTSPPLRATAMAASASAVPDDATATSKLNRPASWTIGARRART